MVNRSRLDAYKVFEDILSKYGEFDVYELTAGKITSNDSNIDLSFPAYYITNISMEIFNRTQFNEDIKLVSEMLEPMFYNKEAFVGGVATISFVITGIVTASWMLFFLLFLSSNTIPNSLILTNLFFSVGHSVMLAKLTSILNHQYLYNYSDMDEVKHSISFASDYLIVRSISTLLIWVSWIDIMVQISKFSWKRRIVIWGGILAVADFLFRLFYGLYYVKPDHNGPTFYALKVVHFFLNYLILVIFIIQVARYTFKKRQFAYNRRTTALAIFSWTVMIVPFIFCTIDLSSDTLRGWSTYIFSFSVLTVTIVIWEWLHTIRVMEVKYERKAVLGRRISNDSFLEDPMNPSLDPKHHHNNGYILKSINILTLLSYLNFWGKLKPYFKSKYQAITSNNTQDHPENVSFYEMVDDLSRQSSYQASNESYDNHPEFNVDHRYLRNTPSTFAGTSRNTPMSIQPAANTGVDPELQRSQIPTPHNQNN